MIPVVETERFRLRGMDLADFDHYAQIWMEPEVVRFISSGKRSLSVSWGAFLKLAGGWSLSGYGQWGIELRATGDLVGCAGFFDEMRGVGADFDAAPEFGCVLSAQMQGKGYGAEVMRAAHNWFDVQIFGGISNAMVQVDHATSIALARQMGYVDLRIADYLGDQVLLMQRNILALSSA